ncbi:MULTISPECIES: hypothetical protein [Luteibacter]|uniref:hypothetical protein n=1 Tax=Luteibacter sp. dw_328 TaxID=2719796 RepID=UPI0009ECF2CB|nr:MULTISPECIES: hypothetical protein [Luteibacter]
MAKYVIELTDGTTGEIAEILFVEAERSDELLAMVVGDRLFAGDPIPLSSGDIESIVARFDLSAPKILLDGWLRPWSYLDQLPYTVHTRRELRLMLAGVKPLAAFVDDMPDVPDNGVVPEEIFAPYVSSGRLVKRESASLRSGHACRDVLYSLPSEAWRIEAYLLLMEALHRDGWSEEMERMQGSLLGYSDSQNDAYVELLRRRTSEGGSF